MKRTDQSAERFFCVLVEQKNKQNNNRRYKMNHCKTIAIVNQKGGVGKPLPPSIWVSALRKPETGCCW